MIGDKWVVRVFAPQASRGHGRRRLTKPAARLPPTGFTTPGFFEAVLSDAGATRLRAYRLRYQRRTPDTRPEKRRPVFLRPAAGRTRPAPLHRGANHHRIYDKLGAHLREVGGVKRMFVLRVGTQRPARERRGRFQRLGRPRQSHAQVDGHRRVGNLPARHHREHALQVRGARRARRHPAQERPVRLLQPARPQNVVARLGPRPLRLERRRVDAVPPHARLAEGTRQRLRGPPGKLEARARGRTTVP